MKRLAIVVIQQYPIIEPARVMRIPVVVTNNGFGRAMRGCVASNHERIMEMAKGYYDDIFVDCVDWATDKTMAGMVIEK